MQRRRIYLLHPQDKFLPVVTEWVKEARETLQGDEQWSRWELFAKTYSDQNSFNVRDIITQVRQTVGPLVLSEPVQTKPRELLREALRSRTVVLVEPAGDSTDIYRLLEDARRRFESGEPYLPRKFVAAVLIVRKLAAGHYWGGNAKGYMYADVFAKGRGVPFADIVVHVAHVLLVKGVLITKPSQGRTKYALNPERKAEVYSIVENASFDKKALHRLLTKDKNEVSARLLESTT